MDLSGALGLVADLPGTPTFLYCAERRAHHPIPDKACRMHVAPPGGIELSEGGTVYWPAPF